ELGRARAQPARNRARPAGALARVHREPPARATPPGRVRHSGRGPALRDRAWNMVVPPAVRGAPISRELGAGELFASISILMLVTHGRDDAIVLPSMAEYTLSVCA